MPDQFQFHKFLSKKLVGKLQPKLFQRFLPYSLISKEPKLKGIKTHKHRFEVHQDVLSPLKDEKILYLEFGVFRGESILHAAANNASSESLFIGFDSFEGLPTTWGNTSTERFDVGGNLPKTDDSRVRFIKGWFNETLPSFLQDISEWSLREGRRIVIHIDSDLYGSALYVLTSLLPLFPEFYLIFDEFCGEESRAFYDIKSAYPFTYDFISCTREKYGYPFCVALKLQSPLPA